MGKNKLNFTKQCELAGSEQASFVYLVLLFRPESDQFPLSYPNRHPVQIVNLTQKRTKIALKVIAFVVAPNLFTTLILRSDHNFDTVKHGNHYTSAYTYCYPSLHLRHRRFQIGCSRN